MVKRTIKDMYGDDAIVELVGAIIDALLENEAIAEGILRATPWGYQPGKRWGDLDKEAIARAWLNEELIEKVIVEVPE